MFILGSQPVATHKMTEDGVALAMSNNVKPFPWPVVQISPTNDTNAASSSPSRDRNLAPRQLDFRAEASSCRLGSHIWGHSWRNSKWISTIVEPRVDSLPKSLFSFLIYEIQQSGPKRRNPEHQTVWYSDKWDGEQGVLSWRTHFGNRYIEYCHDRLCNPY